jgi:hypothetical protein
MSETVKVRIAVAVDPEGSWRACGWDGLDEQEALAHCVDYLGTGTARYILTAELPVPKVSEVEARVEVQA